MTRHRGRTAITSTVTLIALIGGSAGSAPSANLAEISTRISPGSQPYWVEQLASGLDFPTSLAWLPDGDLLITERQRGLRIFHDGRLAPEPVGGTPASFAMGPNGYKDVLPDPDYEANRTLFLLMSEGTYEQYHAAVYRARYAASGLTDVERIFRSKDDLSGWHSIAGRMLFLSDKTLLLGVTSSTDDDKEKALAQQLSSHKGKILRINRDGTVPSDNPFLNTPGALPEIWSYGHRVPLGLYQDPQSGEVWELDSGPRGGDELNLLKAGGNFGWAKTSWGFAYNNGGLAAPLQSDAAVEEPIFVWTPSVTPSGLTRCRGAIYPPWNEDYFVGHLTAKALVRLRIAGRRVVLQELMLMDLDERIRDVKIGPDGYIYLLTDQSNGRLLRLRPGQPRAAELSRIAHKLESSSPPAHTEADTTEPQPGDPVKGRQAFLEHCVACHSVGNLVPGGRIGPDLAGIYGHRSASKSDFSYSAAMRKFSIVWNAVSLDRFLADPSNYVPGTAMAAAPLTDREERQHIAAFLQQHAGE